MSHFTEDAKIITDILKERLFANSMRTAKMIMFGAIVLGVMGAWMAILSTDAYIGQPVGVAIGFILIIVSSATIAIGLAAWLIREIASAVKAVKTWHRIKVVPRRLHRPPS